MALTRTQNKINYTSHPAVERYVTGLLTTLEGTVLPDPAGDADLFLVDVTAPHLDIPCDYVEVHNDHGSAHLYQVAYTGLDSTKYDGRSSAAWVIPKTTTAIIYVSNVNKLTLAMLSGETPNVRFKAVIYKPKDV